MAGRAVYPGTFNPLTVAHLAIAEAALAQLPVGRVDVVVSRVPLAKEHLNRPRLSDRVAVLRRAAQQRPWMHVEVTDDQLLADIAEGYDFLVIGADKWHELHDARFYENEAARSAALSRLPELAVAPRPPSELPDAARRLDLSDSLAGTSSTAVRDGALELMAPEAAAFDRETGAWSDPERYERWLAAKPRSS